jgi:hypothetical protein
MGLENLRLLSKKEAKNIRLLSEVTYIGGKDSGDRGSWYGTYLENMTPGKKYIIKNKTIEKGNNISLDVEDDSGKKLSVHRRFFGVRI